MIIKSAIPNGGIAFLNWVVTRDGKKWKGIVISTEKVKLLNLNSNFLKVWEENQTRPIFLLDFMENELIANQLLQQIQRVRQSQVTNNDLSPVTDVAHIPQVDSMEKIIHLYYFFFS